MIYEKCNVCESIFRKRNNLISICMNDLYYITVKIEKSFICFIIAEIYNCHAQHIDVH